jgi:hypothetical protein
MAGERIVSSKSADPVRLLEVDPKLDLKLRTVSGATRMGVADGF